MNKNTISGIVLALSLTGIVNANTPQHYADKHYFDKKTPVAGQQYGLVTTLSCVRTPFQQPLLDGIDGESGQLNIDAEALETVGTAIMEFNHDGTLKLDDGELTEISFSQISAGQTPVLPPSKVNCNGNYSMSNRNQISMTMSCSVQASQPGVSVTLEPLSFKGFVSRRANIINLADIPGEIQTVSVIVNDTVVQKRDRVCTMTGALTKLHGRKKLGEKYNQ